MPEGERDLWAVNLVLRVKTYEADFHHEFVGILQDPNAGEIDVVSNSRGNINWSCRDVPLWVFGQ